MVSDARATAHTCHRNADKGGRTQANGVKSIKDLRPCSSAEVTADLVAKSLLANSFASLRGLKEGAEKEVLSAPQRATRQAPKGGPPQTPKAAESFGTKAKAPKAKGKTTPITPASSATSKPEAAPSKEAAPPGKGLSKARLKGAASSPLPPTPKASSGGIKVLIRASSAPANPKPAPSNSDCTPADIHPLRRLSVASWGSASYADVLMTRGPSAVMAAVPEELTGGEGGGCLGASAGEGDGTGGHATGGGAACEETKGFVCDGEQALAGSKAEGNGKSEDKGKKAGPQAGGGNRGNAHNSGQAQKGEKGKKKGTAKALSSAAKASGAAATRVKVPTGTAREVPSTKEASSSGQDQPAVAPAAFGKVASAAGACRVVGGRRTATHKAACTQARGDTAAKKPQTPRARALATTSQGAPAIAKGTLVACKVVVSTADAPAAALEGGAGSQGGEGEGAAVVAAQDGEGEEGGESVGVPARDMGVAGAVGTAASCDRNADAAALAECLGCGEGRDSEKGVAVPAPERYESRTGSNSDDGVPESGIETRVVSAGATASGSGGVASAVVLAERGQCGVAQEAGSVTVGEQGPHAAGSSAAQQAAPAGCSAGAVDWFDAWLPLSQGRPALTVNQATRQAKAFKAQRDESRRLFALERGRHAACKEAAEQQRREDAATIEELRRSVEAARAEAEREKARCNTLPSARRAAAAHERAARLAAQAAVSRAALAEGRLKAAQGRLERQAPSAGSASVTLARAKLGRAAAELARVKRRLADEVQGERRRAAAAEERASVAESTVAELVAQLAAAQQDAQAEREARRAAEAAACEVRSFSAQREEVRAAELMRRVRDGVAAEAEASQQEQAPMAAQISRIDSSTPNTAAPQVQPTMGGRLRGVSVGPMGPNDHSPQPGTPVAVPGMGARSMRRSSIGSLSGGSGGGLSFIVRPLELRAATLPHLESFAARGSDVGAEGEEEEEQQQQQQEQQQSGGDAAQVVTARASGRRRSGWARAVVGLAVVAAGGLLAAGRAAQRRSRG